MLDNLEDPLAILDGYLTDDQKAESDTRVAERLFEMNLKDLRETYHVRQEDMVGFSQPRISKIEKNKNLTVHTLMDYVNAMGLTMEIRVIADPAKVDGPAEKVLLRAYARTGFE